MSSRAVPAVLAAALVAACGAREQDAGPGPLSPPATTCPVPVAIAAPTFSADVLPRILRTSCGAGSVYSCHGGTSPPGKVSWDPARTAAEVLADLVDVAPRNAPGGWMLVAPGHVESSWIVEKVTQDYPGGSGYGARMPYSLPNLCDPTVETLANWIAGGAPAD
jgi:hypothetical protein